MLKERSKSKSKSKFPKPKLTYTIDKIEEALGDKADYFLNHKSTTIP